MHPEKLTTKSQEAIRSALGLAGRRGNPEIIPEQILLAAIQQSEGIAAPLLERAGADLSALSTDLEARAEGLPQVSGGGDPSFGRRVTQLITRAEDQAKKLKDDYVSVEHLVLAAASGDSALEAVFLKHKLSYDKLLGALSQIRGSQRVTDQDPEGKFQALDKYTRDLTDLARRQKIDPVVGRDEEIRRVMQVLSRRTKNPCLLASREWAKPQLPKALHSALPRAMCLKA
jgi:ATP-dependent Clp protease ATP-binding subunit ClpB